MDIMNFLSIDCSTDTGSLFLKAKSKTFSKILQSDKSNNDLLMKQILNFFEENNLQFKDISRIFVNQGPGNFSGLRGSIAIAKGLSLSNNLKLSGYDTFIWSCAKFLDKPNLIYSLIKFRGKYFLKKFNKDFTSFSQIEEKTEEEILVKYESTNKVIPKKLSKEFSEKILGLNNLSIVELEHSRLEFLQLKGLLNEDSVKPIYLS